jgi:ferredoxin-thioredoxin reductase catalytic subunit
VEEQVEQLYIKLKQEAEAGGYQFNPDAQFAKQLLGGMLKNKERYGYLACPCRLASGKKVDDLDIICPCDYRDADLQEFHMCYCGLYVTDSVVRVEEEVHSIPERRPLEGNKTANKMRGSIGSLALPVYRCTVCGYLCARENPPEVCPICKVTKERFERFI